VTGGNGSGAAVVRPLAHLKVLDAASGAAGSFAALMFVQGGATVYKVAAPDEPAGGQPFVMAYLDAGKTVIPPADEPGLRSEVDVVIADPGHDWTPWLDEAAHSVVSGAVYGIGPDGPKAHWRVNEMVIATLGGATEYTTTPAGVPAFGYGQRYQRVAGMYLYAALLAVLHAGSRAQVHPQVQVSEFETVVSLLGYSTTQYAYNGSNAIVGQAGPRYTLRCTDGYLVLGANGDWENLSKLFPDPALATDSRFATQGARYKHAEILGGMLVEWSADKTVAEAVASAAACTVPVVPLATADSLLNDDHLRQRDAWERVDVPGHGTGRAPRAAAILDGHRLSRSSA
jgi:crotonobetainyl-CoA:carnitine CoA-transferase CaiB-like acyl-CoA transferase